MHPMHSQFEAISQPCVVHFLLEGRALCGKPGVPGSWGPGHKWVRTDSDEGGPRDAANCEACIRQRDFPFVDVPAEGAIDDDFPQTDPPLIDPEDAFDLLRAVLAWRAQGNRTKWKTTPSLALVAMADRMRERYPNLCATLSVAPPEDPTDG